MNNIKLIIYAAQPSLIGKTFPDPEFGRTHSCIPLLKAKAHECLYEKYLKITFIGKSIETEVFNWYYFIITKNIFKFMLSMNIKTFLRDFYSVFLFKSSVNIFIVGAQNG